MAKIVQMTPQLANLIAAGEVVERPGSVVKELVENAVDAEARHIIIEIKSGGVAYIRVTDDGTGILPEDVRTAFLRHATSKLYTEKQLAAIGTLGFRGEALSSIASVSKMDVFTRTKHYDAGIQISLEAGEESYFGDTGCPVGTTVVVRELFYNVPARAKFLKKDVTEAAYSETAVIQAAMAHPEVAFHFIRDGRETFRTSGDGKLLNVLRIYCGAETADRLRAVTGSFGEISLEGYVSPPDVNRANRNLQNFFINGRPVRSHLLTAAAEAAYKGRMTVGRNPLCFIALHIPPAAVDVNVHPAKLEVKFSREKDIFSAIYYAVQSSLEAGERISALRHGTPLPHEDHVTEEQQKLPKETVYTCCETYASTRAQVAEGGGGIPYSTKKDGEVPPPAAEKMPAYVAPILDHIGMDVKLDNYTPKEGQLPASEEAVCASMKQTAKEEIPPVSAPAEKMRSSFPFAAIPEVRVLGELFHTYLLAEESGGVWLIDKHAAREKQIYNKLTSGTAGMAGQLMLEPLSVTLSPVEKAACLEHRDLLAQAGFEIEDFGAGSILVRQIPMYLQISDVSSVLSDTAQRLLDRKMPDSETLDALRKSVSCKAAIKAGMESNVRELQKFAGEVLADPAVRNCPHGRPAVAFITKVQLEKLFKRIL